MLVLLTATLTAAYTHIIDGSAVTGKLVKRKCTTKLHIWYLVDASDRRAIVVLEGTHNHPTPHYTKVSQDVHYQDAMKKLGVIGVTATKVDHGMLP